MAKKKEAQEHKIIRMTRSDLIALLRHQIHKPPRDCVHCEVGLSIGDKGDIFMAIQGDDALVIKWR